MKTLISEEIISRWSKPARVLVRAIRDAGNKIKFLSRDAGTKPGEGHRSITTESDNKVSQPHILRAFEAFPEMKFLCEEASDDPRVVRENFHELFSGTSAVIDPLDGTTLYAHGFPEWCVGGGLVENGKITTSVITAPQANGGMFLFSHRGEVYFSEEGRRPVMVPHLMPRAERASVILRGVDTELYANVVRVMPKIAASVRAIYTVGSGHFGLMAVALGRASAIIQTPQKTWDWVPGYHAVTSVGGVFRFFRLDNGKLIPLDSFDEKAFSAKKENRLGFIAGEPGAVEKLFKLLPRSGWERHDPDTL